jgi:hypothetical protein
VPQEVVTEDYGLSRSAMVRMRAWATAHSPELAAVWDSAPSSHLAAEPEAMARLLTALTERHGSVRSYLISLGVSNALLEHLESSRLSRSTSPTGSPADPAEPAREMAGTGWAARSRALL